jgi:hypothetical protein
MNAVEIEEAISRLAEAPFDAANFPFSFLEAFGNKDTTIKRLRSRATNQRDCGDGHMTTRAFCVGHAAHPSALAPFKACHMVQSPNYQLKWSRPHEVPPAGST